MAQNFVRQIPGPVQDGMVITIQGNVPPSANSFSINLSSAPSDIGTSDLMLHLNPRFNENCVPRNTFQNGAWGSEDRSGMLGVPIQRGGPFECRIQVLNDKYMVSFNGRPFCEFRHRLPKERANCVIVKGDAQITNVMFSGATGGMGGFGGQAFPNSGGFGQPPPYSQQPAGFGQQPGGFGQPVGGFGQSVGGFGQPVGGFGQPTSSYGQPSGYGAPLTRKNIPGGMNPGRIIYINATPTPNATKFAVNLKNQEIGGDIAFHFNPRFAERMVAKNSLQYGSWGQEERAFAPFPFVPGTPFSMMVLGDPQEFKVALNGSHFTEYRLRSPNLQAVQWVEVEGDVTNVQINIP